MSVSENDGSVEPEGTGYVSAVDGEGEPDAGEDSSGSEYVDPADSDEPHRPEAGTGYVSAVDGEGVPGAGADESEAGYVEKDEPPD
jgi:hypothetical protein